MWWIALVEAAFAQASITFDFDEQRLADLQIDPDELRSGLIGQAEQDFGLVDPGALLDAFARAAAVSTKGMGVDYASNPDKFVVGAAIGAAVSQQDIAFVRGSTPVPTGGYAFMTSLYGGVNLGIFSPGDPNFLDRIRVYLGGLGFRTPDDRLLRGRTLNVVGHVQVELVQPVIAEGLGSWAEWGGIAATTGLEHARYGIDLTGELPVGYNSSNVGATWHADGTFTIESQVFTVPLEVSSNFRFAFLTIYGGAGFDFDVAQASTTIEVTGPVDVRVGDSTEVIGSGSVTFDAEQQSDPYQPRGFFGAQIDIFAFKIYGHLNFSTSKTAGGFLGMRVAM